MVIFITISLILSNTLRIVHYHDHVFFTYYCPISKGRSRTVTLLNIHTSPMLPTSGLYTMSRRTLPMLIHSVSMLARFVIQPVIKQAFGDLGISNKEWAGKTGHIGKSGQTWLWQAFLALVRSWKIFCLWRTPMLI